MVPAQVAKERQIVEADAEAEGAIPPLHEIAKNVGVELPQYLGKLDGPGEPEPKPAVPTPPTRSGPTYGVEGI